MLFFGLTPLTNMQNLIIIIRYVTDWNMSQLNVCNEIIYVM